MTTTKKLIFLENKADALSFINDFSRRADLLSNAIVYVFDKEAEVLLIENKVDYRTPEELISFRDYNNIDRDSIEFAREWYREEKVGKSLLWNNVSLGSLIQRDLAFFFSIILDGIILSRKVIEHERPDQVYYFKRYFDRVVKSVKASKDETYYGYFSRYFARNTIELESKTTHRDDDENYPQVLFVDYEHDSNVEGKKNILLVNDFDYLDVASELTDALGRQYSIKYLKKNKGGKKYRIRPADGFVAFDFSELKYFFQYQNINFFDVMCHKLHYFQRKTFPFLKCLLETLRRLIREEGIDCVVVTEDAMPFNKTVVTAAKSMGIVTIVLQKGLCVHDISFVPVTADKFAAWGQAAKDYLVSRGVAESKIELTGCPRFQNYYKASVLRKKVFEDLGIKNKYEKIFLITLQHGNRNSFFRNQHLTFHEELKIIKLMIKTMKQFPDDLLCVKFHPQDELACGIFDYLDGEIAENVKATQNYPIEKLLGISDILITCFSTSTLEAILMNVPVVVINIFNRPFNIDFAKEKVAIGVYLDEDLFSVLNAIKQGRASRIENQESFINYHFFQKNINASQNVKKLIDSLTKKQTRWRNEDTIHKPDYQVQG